MAATITPDVATPSFSAQGDDTEVVNLQHLAYKAEYAESISNQMRVPNRIGYDEGPPTNYVKKDPKQYHTIMRVPDKITFAPEPDAQARLHKEKQASILLTTPPRALKYEDNFTFEGVHHADHGSNSPIPSQRQDDDANSTTALIKDDLSNDTFLSKPDNELQRLAELLGEDDTNRVVRQQLFTLYTRIKSLEKKHDQMVVRDERMRYFTYASLGLSVAAIIGLFMSSRSKLY